MIHSQNPKARQAGLVIQEAGDEVLVFDTERNEAHCLNRTAAVVWRACDGENDIAAIARVLEGQIDGKVDEDIVWLAIDQLSKERLLEQEMRLDGKGVSRRDVIRKIGLAAAVALPVVAMLSFPKASLAVTCAASFCGSNGAGNGCGPGEYCCKNPGNNYICQVSPCTNPC